LDDAGRIRIREDLRGFFKGELLFDELSCALYSTDASIFQVMPIGVAAPRDEEDVRGLVRYAAEHQIPLTARGAGTGLAGESLGSGLIVDLSRHLRSILEVSENSVRVQPGVGYHELQARLALAGRRFAPDLTSGVQCTIGGMLATNASGARTLKHGYTRDHVSKVRVVLNNGDAVDVARESRWTSEAAPSGRLSEITRSVAELLDRNRDLIQACKPRTRFNRCGYLLQDVLTAEHVDWPRLLIGSEGTLALFTEATLPTIPLPLGRCLVVLGFSGLDAAVDASHDILETGPASCELVDGRLVTLTRGLAEDLKGLIPSAAAVLLLVEYECDSAHEAADAGRKLVDRVTDFGRRALPTLCASDPDEVERLWRIRESALPSLYGMRGGRQPIPCVEDVGVPVEVLAIYVHKVQEILRRHETTASFLVHAGTGQVHTRPFLDLQKPDDSAKLWALAEEIHTTALELGGTVSTQHGTGLARTPWVARQYGALYPVFRDLKAIFDPQQIFNPGKIVGPDPGRPAWPLRGPPVVPAEGPRPILRWPAREFQAESLNCNGCGHCRTETTTQRMCPIFRATHAEAATPRAKANMLRQLLSTNTDPRALAADEIREVADLCVNCRMCATECPAHVNIPKLMLEAKAANVAEHGLDRTDWTMARTESFAAFASTLSVLVNAALANRLLRWLLEKLFGVARRRRLPRFAGRNFLRRAARRGWTRPCRSERRVAYFVDVYANYNDPQIGEAAVSVLQHNGVEVYVPPGQRGCGMAPLAYGDVESAREVAEQNLRVLAEPARQGYPIVCSEPTAALMLKYDYPSLIDDPDAELVANKVTELTSFLWELHQGDKLATDFRPLAVSVGHHVPCHLKALGHPPTGPSLLALIPGLRVHTIDVGCSGMAGTFGLQARNYETSLQAGRAMLNELSRPQAIFGSTECSTCRLQMEEASGKRTLHPVQFLALAYGLMPELSRRLLEPVRDRVLQ
jgi:FAD/FMN-containing dehydrogenase/Fe-S oxidoreductase